MGLCCFGRLFCFNFVGWNLGMYLCSKNFRENDFTESKYLKIIFPSKKSQQGGKNGAEKEKMKIKNLEPKDFKIK